MTRSRQSRRYNLVSKDQLFEQADILTIHLVLSTRTRGLVGAVGIWRE